MTDFIVTVVQFTVDAGQIVLLPALPHTELGGIGPWHGGGEHPVALIAESVRRVSPGAVPCHFGGDRVCGGCTLPLLTDKPSPTGAVLIIPFTWRHKDDHLPKTDCNKYCTSTFNIIHTQENWGFFRTLLWQIVLTMNHAHVWTCLNLLQILNIWQLIWWKFVSTSHLITSLLWNVVMSKSWFTVFGLSTSTIQFCNQHYTLAYIVSNSKR